jgi:hypothetical protein
MVTFKNMCDKCFRHVGNNEQLVAFKLIDDENREKLFKGHKECMDEVIDILKQLYGTKEKTENDNK